jgi:hypothetical protein
VDRANLGDRPQGGDEALLVQLAGGGHEHDERLSGVAALADDEVPEVALLSLLVVGV